MSRIIKSPTIKTNQHVLILRPQWEAIRDSYPEFGIADYKLQYVSQEQSWKLAHPDPHHVIHNIKDIIRAFMVINNYMVDGDHEPVQELKYKKGVITDITFYED